VNVIAFMACARFVTHVTGTVSQMGKDAPSVSLALDYAAVLASFVLGAAVSATLLDGRYAQKKRPLYAVPLVAVSVMLVGVAVAGSAGLFGEFGGTIETAHDFVLLGILAFASGLQNAAVATSTGLVVRTTHMTGPATDLGMHIATALHTRGDARATALRHAALRAGKIGAFAAGAAAGAALVPTFHFAAFLLPAAVTAVATVLSFVDVPKLETSEPSPA
jgi:uncharacterized membrane protein YoaK (UPF0700 family)